jgi:hypothetical protein
VAFASKIVFAKFALIYGSISPFESALAMEKLGHSSTLYSWQSFKMQVPCPWKTLQIYKLTLVIFLIYLSVLFVVNHVARPVVDDYRELGRKESDSRKSFFFYFLFSV